MSLLCNGEVSCFFTLRPSDLITTLTYILMNNFFVLIFITELECALFLECMKKSFRLIDLL